MGQMSEYFCGELLKIAFNRANYTPPYDRFEVALCTDVPALNADTTQVAEPVGNGYARVYIAFDYLNWQQINYREMQSLQDVNFAAATGFWGTIEGYALFTSSSTDGALQKQMVAVGRLTVPLRVTSGIQPQMPAGSIVFGLYD